MARIGKQQTRDVVEKRLHAFFETLSVELSNVGEKDECQTFAINRQLKRARKRAQFRNPALRPQTISEFLETNVGVGHCRINLDRRILANARDCIFNALERFASSTNPDNIQTLIDWDHLFSLWRFGPGSAYGITGTHAAVKIQQKMTVTAPAEHLVKTLRCKNTYFSSFDAQQGNDGVTIVRGSRLTTVPKNETTERTIGIVPSGNMALQLAAGTYLEEVLRSIGLDIRTQQSRNKDFALRGSIDGSFATIDLSKASDRITPALVRALFPKEWYDLLMRLRMQEIEVPGHGWTKLNMMSTMGEGFTFPLMTFIISALIQGYRMSVNSRERNFIDWTKTCVFGDDIIIPTNEYQGFTAVLEQAGLIVNHDKSYCDGYFRESCGGDYYKGYDVTPFYVQSLASDADVYVALNKVFEWCAKHKTLLPRTLDLLKSFIDGRILFVPEWAQPTSGFRTTQVERNYSLLTEIKHAATLKNDCHYAMMLVCGGYVTPSPKVKGSVQGSDLVYMPRPFKTRYKVRRARLPIGYRSGRDPLTRTASISDYIDSYSFLMRNYS